MTDKVEARVSTGIAEVSPRAFIEGSTVTITTVHKNPQGSKCDVNTGIVKAAFNDRRSAVAACICGTSITINR